ncbi:MAG: hypothetical protein NWE95_13050 [Candidatus Bathyarchaeota archaeon]|nr:hypothetical protein [Candidatus Bathyarchaeota archaeon]
MNKPSNLKRISGLLLVLLIIGLVAPLSTAIAGNQNGQGQQSETGNNSPETPSTNANQTGPNFPDNAKQYNRTDLTPVAQREQVQAREQTLFRYRNMTMLMNCSQNCEVTFTADEEVTPKIFGLTVEPNQTMSLVMNLSRSPLQGAMVNERSLNFYLGIEPNATVQLQAQIRLYINQTELNQNLNREVNASRLTWMYWNQTRAQWEAVESYMDQNGYLVCNTNHFSTWTVAEIEPEAEPSTEPTEDNNIPTVYIVAIVVVAIVAVASGLIAYKKRK